MSEQKRKRVLSLFCPLCGRNEFNRVHRTITERIYNMVSFGKKSSKKYQCKNCGWTVTV